jgi:Lon protease-like protein
VRDALAGSRVIGMTLLRSNWEAEYTGAPEIYRVGCAGRIVDATPLPDGTFNILLAGLREFELVSEQRERAYRQATVIWRDPMPEEPLPDGLRRDLMRAVEVHVGEDGRALTSELDDEDGAIGDTVLVNFLAFWLELSPVEKQALLEATGHERATRLLEILEFQRHVTGSGQGNAAGRRMH